MEGPARAGHDPGGGLRLEWPDFRQPVPDRQGDDGDQLERPSLLRASTGKKRRCRSRKGPPNGRGKRRRELPIRTDGTGKPTGEGGAPSESVDLRIIPIAQRSI